MNLRLAPSEVSSFRGVQWQNIRSLGRGGVANVFLMQQVPDQENDAGLPEFLALKIPKNVKPSEYRGPVEDLMARRDALPPNVQSFLVPYYGVNDDGAWMDFCRGAPEKWILKPNARSSLDEITFFLSDFKGRLRAVLGALKVLEEAQICHGDLKPANIAWTYPNAPILLDLDGLALFNTDFYKYFSTWIFRPPELAGHILPAVSCSGTDPYSLMMALGCHLNLIAKEPTPDHRKIPLIFVLRDELISRAWCVDNHEAASVFAATLAELIGGFTQYDPKNRMRLDEGLALLDSGL